MEMGQKFQVVPFRSIWPATYLHFVTSCFTQWHGEEYDISLTLQEAIFRVIVAILHLGNVEFTKGKDIDSSVLKDDKAKFHLKMTAELLRYISFQSFM